MMQRLAATLVLTTSFVACEKEEKKDSETTYDEALLAQYRAAIPNESQLSAQAPEASDAAQNVGDPSVIAGFAMDPVTAINTQVTTFIGVLKTIVNLPPTHYNAAEQKFIWGPWPNDEGCGQILVYIQDTNDTEDFRYNYAFLQLNDDGSAATPVIFGAATPHATDPDRGVGITLWDFDEANEFTETCTGTPPSNPTTGRWVAMYGDIDDENEPDLQIQFNYSVFADFNPGDDDSANAFDIEIFYGNIDNTADGNTMQFIDFDAVADLCDGNSTDECFDTDVVDDADETLQVTLAFFNKGTGRGEMSMSGGDLGDTTGSVVECWDAAVAQTYLSASDGINSVVLAGTSEAASCSAPFSSSLEELGTPTLDDVPAELRTVINCIAEHGVDAILVEGTCE